MEAPHTTDVVADVHHLEAFALAEKPVAKNLAKFRRRVGLRQSDLAGQLGCSQQLISLWETGLGVARLEHLHRLARVLGCSPEQLIGWRSR